MPAEAAVIVERTGSVVRLRIARPSVDLEVLTELASAYRAIDEDDSILAVVLTVPSCEGEAAELFEIEDAEYRTIVRGWQTDAIEGIAGLKAPVIASIAGECRGMGLELALACDLRVASDAASLAMDQVARGDMPHAGGTQRLSRIAGRGAALEMILLGEAVDAPEAHRIGLVSRVVAPESLDDEAMRLAQAIAAKAPVATRHAREALTRGMDHPLAEGLRLEADLYFLLQTTEDRTEGIRSFLERRPPQFKGR